MSAWSVGERVEIVSGALRHAFAGRVGTVIPPAPDDTRPNRARVAFDASTIVTVSDRYLVDADE